MRFLLPLLLLSGCGPLSFPADLKGSAEVPGSPLGQLLSVFPQIGGFTNLNFEDNQAFKNNNTTRAHVKTMRLTRFTVQVTAPTTQDFSFVDSLQFDVSADGLPHVRVASKSNIGALGLKAPSPTLTLELDDVELGPYVRAASMTISTTGNGRQPPQNTTLEAKLVFIVGVGL